MPTNSTGMSVAGFAKWLLVIAAMACAFQAWQGIVGRQALPLRSRGPVLTGQAAVQIGQTYLGIAAMCLLGAGAAWYFWQRNED